MNATLLALLNTNIPDWISILTGPAFTSDHLHIADTIFEYHFNRGMSLDWSQIFHYARNSTK